VSKTSRFYEALQEERQTEDEFRSRLDSLIGASALRDPALADHLRVEIAEIRSRAQRVFALVWQEVEPSLTSESSEILVALAANVDFLLLRECEKWMLGSYASTK
jgi:hypothetical protein